MFGQLFREMLTDQSFESFRAYSLDSVARLEEALLVAQDIQQDRLPRAAFDPVQAELIWSLGKDPTARHLVERETEAFVQFTKSPNTIDEIIKYVIFIQRYLATNYKEQCEAGISAVISEPDRRVELRQSAGFYCSHLLNLGFSKTFLLNKVDEIFFKLPLKRPGRPTLKKFFRQFQIEDINFIVYTAVDSSFGKYLQSLEFTTYASANQIPTGIRRNVGNTLPLGPEDVYLFSRISARDENSAAAEVESTLASVKALAFMVPHDMKVAWSQQMYAVRGRAALGTVMAAQALPLHRVLVPPSTSRRAFKALRSYSGRLLTNFDGASTERIISSINTGAVARTSDSIENQLISLWSAIEILLTEPARGVVRITHYSKLLVPCICLRYIRRQIIAVFNEMLVNYRKRFTEIVSSEPEIDGHDQHTKFAAILLREPNEALRVALINLCNENPLALHRLWKLRRDFSSPRLLKKTLTEHEDRVGWQLHRIYGARNNLVHAGKQPKYLDSLILNLDEFFRACLGTLVNRASRDEQDPNLDQLIAEIGIEYRIQMGYWTTLQKDQELSLPSVIKAVM
jgi:hypothetical protein